MSHPISSRVKHQNTSESDLQEEVIHVVTFDDGTTLDVIASDPAAAIAKAVTLNPNSHEI